MHGNTFTVSVSHFQTYLDRLGYDTKARGGGGYERSSSGWEDNQFPKSVPTLVYCSSHPSSPRSCISKISTTATNRLFLISNVLRLLLRIKAIVGRISDAGRHIGPIPLERHWHLPEILRHERLLEGGHVEGRGAVGGVRRLHVVGEIGTEVAGGRRAHHVGEAAGR